MTTRTFCTILSTNYLPKALALAESLRQHEDGALLHILFIDVAHDDGLPQLDGVVCLSTEALGLPERTVLELTMSYDLVEFATAIKPLLFRRLLDEADQVFYLDPDTYVLSPMRELSSALEASAGGILLTPHFLRPPPLDAEISDGHMLLVGVNNLGFGGFDRRSFDMLDWWWGHLRRECLYDPLAGLFVDQKWMDIGATLFQAGSFRHAGYNVGVANLSERPLAEDADGYHIPSTGERLRLFHFHAFDSDTPEKISVRFRHSNGSSVQDDSVVLQLCKEYATVLSGYEQSLPAPPPYPYATDTRGRPISRQLRRAYGREAAVRRHAPPVTLRHGRGPVVRTLAPARLALHRTGAPERDREVRAHRPARRLRAGAETVPGTRRQAQQPFLGRGGELGLTESSPVPSRRWSVFRRGVAHPLDEPGHDGLDRLVVHRLEQLAVALAVHAVVGLRAGLARGQVLLLQGFA